MSVPIAKLGIQNIKAHMIADGAPNLPPVSIALNSNESAFGPSPLALDAAKAAAAGLERYFEDPGKILIPAIADRFGLQTGRIAIGQGSDDLLARIARAYLGPGTEMLRSANGYPKTPNYAHANDAIPVAVPDTAFRASVDNLLAAVTEKTRVVYLANPENPAGSHLGGADVRRLHAGLPDHVLLVLDCAYEDYVDAEDYEPGHRLVEEAENVVMVRTFSKIFGLAGARVGWLYGPPDVVETVSKIALTFPLASPSVAAAVAALKDRAHFNWVREQNSANRTELSEALCRLGLEIYPSQTNFVLADFRGLAISAEMAAARLRCRGISVRRLAPAAYRTCIRITLGTASELAFFEKALADILSEHR